MTRPNAATQAQIDAADPTASTWLSANAGSGKTRVLTNRVARLLLGGCDPQNILCLTYTNAAAGEMQNRLFDQLGRWAMLDDAALFSELEGLGEILTDTDIDLPRARRLFATAIEAPGGLKIQTIHSFCSSILRRFPLEARVSPSFSEIDDRTAERLRLEVLDDMVSGGDLALLEPLLPYLNDTSITSLTKSLLDNQDLFVPARADVDIAACYGIAPTDTAVDAIRAAVSPSDASLIESIIEVCGAVKKSYAELGHRLAEIDTNAPTIGDFEYLVSKFVTKDATSKAGSYPLKNHFNAIACFAHIQDEFDAWMDRIAAANQFRLTILARDRTLLLHRFARRFFEAYEARKMRAGLLDYDDLIRKARGLLTDPAVAQWVLYKLDGGIDHLLVDEAQDTSPMQWQVIETLAQEFATGEGSRADRERTIFVVGDKKQSIYSFQGADPEGFDRMCEHFDAKLLQIGKRLQRLPLSYSFRSSAAILGLVDQTFVGERAKGLEDKIFHRAYKSELPGRVDLWPPLEPTEKEEPADWTTPVDRRQEAHHDIRLARLIADQMAQMIGQPLPVSTRDGSIRSRPITAGDFLILVRSRSPLFAEIIRACKARNLPIAGADRFKLRDVLAVKDILSLLRFLALAEDDLALAEALRSPIFGWSEQQLFTLAKGRSDGEYLWTRLRSVKCDALTILNDLRQQSDFLRPYDLISRILIKHGARKSLVARLGHEVTDGIDALLARALDYEANNVPSLTGFLAWLDGDDAEIKRQVDSSGDRIRVMTVHGAKGLEAPIVILPQTLSKKKDGPGSILKGKRGGGLWYTKKGDAPAILNDTIAEVAEANVRESRRLLYVAMTRAENWLIVAGAGEYEAGSENWYDLVNDGMKTAGAVEFDHPTGRGLRHAVGAWGGWPEAAAGEDEAGGADDLKLAAFGPPARTKTLSPSDLGGAKALFGEVDAEEDVLARGRLVHALLEHLPTVDADLRAALSRSILASHPDTANVADAEALADRAIALVATPDLAPLFAPGTLAEVDVTAQLVELDNARIHGAVDRLIIDAKRVLVVDFKTNRIVPETPDHTPEGVLRQMGAYAAALRNIYPNHVIETAILWVQTGKLMQLPDALVAQALLRAGRP